MGNCNASNVPCGLKRGNFRKHSPMSLVMTHCCCGLLKIQKNTPVAPLIPQPPLSTRPATNSPPSSISIASMVTLTLVLCGEK